MTTRLDAVAEGSYQDVLAVLEAVRTDDADAVAKAVRVLYNAAPWTLAAMGHAATLDQADADAAADRGPADG